MRAFTRLIVGQMQWLNHRCGSFLRTPVSVVRIEVVL